MKKTVVVSIKTKTRGVNKTMNMRREWFLYVAKTRKKMARGKKGPVTHRSAMKEAALSWGKEKAKLLNREKREQRRLAKEGPSKAIEPPAVPQEPTK